MLAKNASAKTTGEAFAWNAGADSAAELGGVGLRVVFSPSVDWLGVAIGLRPADDEWAPGYLTRLTHALFCFGGASPVAQVIEGGVPQGTPFAYADGDVLTIDRANSVVTYLLNGVVQYTSATPSVGFVRASACLYGPQDTVQ